MNEGESRPEWQTDASRRIQFQQAKIQHLTKVLIPQLTIGAFIFGLIIMWLVLRISW